MSESQVFAQALKFDSPAERAAYLDRVCAGSPELRTAVEDLLRARMNDPDFLEEPIPFLSAVVAEPGAKPSTLTVEPTAIGRPGAVLNGRYKLLELISEGGMGAVWTAEQTEPVKRLVAVKLIRAGMDTRQVVARFEAERQALALMDHPNIAKVLDAGTSPDGRPFFVMELVKGVPLTQFCDDRRLNLRQRLELFVPVCQAVQHAHQKGVIHRDIKPGNVLVALYDDRPVPKVIDFGVAKAMGQKLTEATLYTGFGAVVGTVEYMSPEQASLNELDVDTRSDIYSLGVLLYELLAGSPPFTKKEFEDAGILEMMRLIREKEPSTPSAKLSTEERLAALAASRGTDPAKLARLVRGELDWIVMRCLEKERARRYETASGLAQDIERYLADEPVQACPPSVPYRLKKFVSRNRGPVLATSLVFLALVGGTAGMTWGLIRAERARRAEAERAEGERQAKQAAEAREAESRAVVEFFENRILAAARPEGQAGGLGREVTLRQALEAALPYVEKGFADQPLIEAQLRMTLGTTFFYLGNFGTAADQFEQARAIYTHHLGLEAAQTLRSKNHLALSYEELGRYDDALKLIEQVLAVHMAKLGPDHPDTMTSMHNLAIIYNAIGRHAEALKLLARTVELRRTTLGPDHPDTLRSMNNLGVTYTYLYRHTDALKLREETFALMKAKLGAEHPDTLKSMGNLALTYSYLRRYADSVKLYSETLSIRRAKLGNDHPDTLRAMDFLALNYSAMGQNADAAKLNEEVLAFRKAKLGPDHPDTIHTMSNLAVNYSNLGRYEEALKLKEEALKRLKAKYGLENRNTLRAMNNLAASYEELGRYEEALKLHEETLRLRKTHLGPDDPDTLWSMDRLAYSYGIACRHEEALKLSEQTLALRRSKLGSEHPDTLTSMQGLGLRYHALGRYEEALKLTQETLELRKTRIGPEHADTLRSMHILAICYSNLDRNEEALKTAEETLAIRKVKLGSDHPETLRTSGYLARIYFRLGRFSEAQKLQLETLALLKTKLGAHHPDTLQSMNSLAWYLVALPDTKTRDPQRAVELAAKAAESSSKPGYWGTLGVARYRAGEWKSAIIDLEKAISLRHGDDPDSAYEGFFLAMAYWRLGDQRQAQEWFAKSARWMDKANKNKWLLARFRAEAADLLGIKENDLGGRLNVPSKK